MDTRPQVKDDMDALNLWTKSRR